MRLILLLMLVGFSSCSTSTTRLEDCADRATVMTRKIKRGSMSVKTEVHECSIEIDLGASHE